MIRNWYDGIQQRHVQSRRRNNHLQTYKMRLTMQYCCQKSVLEDPKQNICHLCLTLMKEAGILGYVNRNALRYTNSLQHMQQW